MRLIPPQISKKTISSAEKRFFEELREIELKGNPVCLHSLNLSKHKYKAIGEIDFVLIFSGGLYVLEVKGGGISFREGIWHYEDRWGNIHRSSEGPFNQAKSGMYSLIRNLENEFHIPKLREVTFGYGVVFPDCWFDIQSVEWDQSQIMDSKVFKQDKVKDYLLNLNLYWHEKFLGKPATISDTTIGHLIRSLRPNFDLVKDLFVEVDEIEARIHSLTEEQYERLDMVEHCPKLLVEGGAGTGKTMLAVEISKRHARQGQSVLFLCFSHLLANHLRKRISENDITIYPIHQYLIEIVNKYSDLPEGYLPGRDVSDPWFKKKLLPAFFQITDDLPEHMKSDVLVVDEGQDILNLDYISVLDKLLVGGIEDGTWRIFYDPNHQSVIYNSMSEEVVEMLKSYGAVPPRLTVNCRNTDPIIMQTRLITGANLSEQSAGPGPDVELIFFDSKEDLADQLSSYINDLLCQRVDPSDITILSSKNFQNSAASIMDASLSGNIKVLSGSVNETFPHPSITFSKMTDFKGLENNFIILADIDQMDSDQLNLAKLYVGMTRARMQLLICLKENLRDEFEKLQINNLKNMGKVQ